MLATSRQDAFTVFLQEYVDPTIDVLVDIKPGSFPNSINLGSRGATPVAILGTASFDATEVDPLTVKLADADVRVKGNGTPQASFSDVDGDGFLDLVVHMETEGLQLTSDDVEAALLGALYDTTPIRGADSVRVVP